MRSYVIAMACEAEAIRPALRAGDRLYLAGVGKVNAAAATMKAIQEGADEIWNVGVCGGFGADITRGGIYGVARAVEYDFDLAQVNGTAIGVLDECDSPYIPLADPAEVVPDLAARPWYGGSRTLATGDRFSDSEADYGLIVDTLGASLRDMEGAAVAHVAMKCAVRCVSLKCVTNVAGQGSMTGQYAEHRADCLARLAAALKELYVH